MKAKCDNCQKKVVFKVKKKSMGTLQPIDFYYTRCSKCKTVYPAYVEDHWVRDKKKEVESMQTTAWKDKTINPKEKVKLLKEILRIQKEVEYVSKTLLVKRHQDAFELFGNGVYTKWS